ncbi:MAG: acetolactate synthase small subunit [Clostridiales bacterium]|nr:acetolactate synthase small subunit [Clostridiales bacterium]
MKHIISVLVENHAGVLSRISGLFSRRAFNIDSLAVGVTDDPKVSRITIIVDGNQHTVEQVEKQLNKLIDVIKVKRFDRDEHIARELVLIKVLASSEKRAEIMTVAEVTGAEIIDISLTTMTLQLADTYAHVQRLEEIVRPYGILEVVRTGTIAIQKGAEAITHKK